MSKTKKQNIYYEITFRDPKDGQILSLKAQKIADSTLGLSFITISEFLFDTDKLVVTPDQEALEKRLEGVKALHLSIYSVLSIKEIGNDNKGLKFKKDRSNLVVLSSVDRPSPPTSK
ncbi:MAG: DUF1820 family protein [Bdellovibrionales bacterium]|nr:DUF1820 family protein [Bdellovibrionales bacterium]